MADPERHSRAVSISVRVYQSLLAAYPREFREEYGTQMVQLFGEAHREEVGQRGRAALIPLWLWSARFGSGPLGTPTGRQSGSTFPSLLSKADA